MTEVLSTSELAQAIGVSESSIKRWADDGTIRSSRTAGGHRRIPVPEAIRFIRDSGAAVLRPDILGLSDIGAIAATASGNEGEQLFEFLAHGAAPQARGLVQAMYLDGASVAAIIDGPVRSAMRGIGELWRHDPGGVFVEHRATDICVQALNQLRAIIPAANGGPSAIGGAAAGDIYLLPSLAAATVLSAEGFDAINLGPQLPFESLRHAIEQVRPMLVWMSVSVLADQPGFASSLMGFTSEIRSRGVSVVVGGQALATGSLPKASNLHVGSSMAELAAFARGLKAGYSPAAESAGGGE